MLSDNPAADSYVTVSQHFVRRETMVGDDFCMNTDNEFLTTLEDNIRKDGTVDKLVSDCVKVESRNCTMI
jgi:hypothetical protein